MDRSTAHQCHAIHHLGYELHKLGILTRRDSRDRLRITATDGTTEKHLVLRYADDWRWCWQVPEHDGSTTFAFGPLMHQEHELARVIRDSLSAASAVTR